ncbi:hypothetical protein GRC12_16380 [Streptomyces griseorubiginosus]|nr:hypothetical protein [Streptomyces griseorubiginosus]
MTDDTDDTDDAGDTGDTGDTGAGAVDAERDAILAALRPVVVGIAATFGPVCEAVLHDYRHPENSVVAVAGSVTGRAVGGAMSEIGLRVLARGDRAEDELNYVTRTPSGTLVKASTMVLRDSTGAVFGALCLNVDVTAVQEARALLGALSGVAAGAADAPVTTFGNDIDSVVDALLDAHRIGRNRPWAALDRAERLDLFRALDDHGVFAVRRAVEQVAGRLGISRASAYSYLSQARAASAPPTAGGPAAGAASARTTAGGPAAGAASAPSTAGGPAARAASAPTTAGGPAAGAASARITAGGSAAGAASAPTTAGGPAARAASAPSTAAGPARAATAPTTAGGPA